MQRKRSNSKKWKDVITFAPFVDQDFHKARSTKRITTVKQIKLEEENEGTAIEQWA